MCVYACEEDVHEKSEKKEKRKRKEREDKNLFIETSKQTYKQTDR